MTKEEKKEYRKGWLKAHPKYYKVYLKAWREAHPNYSRDHYQALKAGKKSKKGSLFKTIINLIKGGKK